MKTIEDHFADWESFVFGFGYGSGEEVILPALHKFFSLCSGLNGAYDSPVLETSLGAPVAWLLINALARHRVDVIEYGISPRFGWLSECGQALRAFVVSKTPEQLIAMVCRDSDYTPCLRDYCNCDNGPCINPFWKPVKP